MPSVIVALDALPVTPNGKLDRGALPEPGRGASGAGAAVRRASHADGGAARRDLGRPLPVDRVGIDDNFFDLGGHSMLALRARPRGSTSGWRVDVFLTVVFEHPTVRGLAEAVAASMLEDEGDDDLDALLDELETADA